MNSKFFVTGFFVVVFLILATASEWTSKVNTQGDSSMNTTESEGAVSNLTLEENDTTSGGIGSSIPSSTPEENDTTSGGIGSSIPSPSTTSNESNGANTTA